MKAKVIAALLVTHPAIVSGFSPLPESFRTLSLEDQCLTRRYDAVKDVKDLLRDARAYARDWLPPIYPDEFYEMVKPDFDAIGDDLQSSDAIQVVQKKNWLQRSVFIGFEPLDNPKGVGFVFYPGALVRAESYAPMCRRLAEQGYHAVLLTPPMLLSLYDVDAADAAIQYYGDDVSAWAVSGHSMGGVVAAAYANQHVDEFKNKLKAVVLLASYPSAIPDVISAGDLSDDSYDTTSIYGSLDGLTTLPFIEASKALLPSNTKFIRIEGGNHSGFYYGKDLQLGDNPATIDRDEQQKITLQTICKVLESIAVEDKAEA